MTQSIALPKYIPLVGLLICFGISGVAQKLFDQDKLTKGLAYSYLQPDDKSFSIWGLIYLFHALFVIRALTLKVFEEKDEYKKATFYVLLNFVTNGTWLLVNGFAVSGQLSYWLSVLVLWLNLYSLYHCYTIIDVDYTKLETSSFFRSEKLSFYTATSLNLSWVVLASNIILTNTLYASSQPSIVAVGSPDWAIAILTLACCISLYLTFTRLDIPYAFILIWGCFGIIRNQSVHSKHFDDKTRSITLYYYALGVAVVNAGNIVFSLIVFFLNRKRKRETETETEPEPYCPPSYKTFLSSENK